MEKAINKREARKVTQQTWTELKCFLTKEYSNLIDMPESKQSKQVTQVQTNSQRRERKKPKKREQLS